MAFNKHVLVTQAPLLSTYGRGPLHLRMEPLGHGHSYRETRLGLLVIVRLFGNTYVSQLTFGNTYVSQLTGAIVSMYEEL